MPKRKGNIVTDPYVDISSKKVIISIGTPVKENGRFMAAMFYDMELGGLADLVNNVNLHDAGYLFIVTADGTTIAHPDATNNGENIAKYLPQAVVKSGEQTFEQDEKNLQFTLSTYLQKTGISVLWSNVSPSLR